MLLPSNSCLSFLSLAICHFYFGFKNLVVDDENVGVFAEILTLCGDIPMIKKLNTGMMLSY